MLNPVKTLSQFIVETQSLFPHATGGFTRLMSDISTAAKIVNREVNRAGLAEILGSAGTTNIQGEEVKKLDVLANEQFIAALSAGGECCVIASEENDHVIPVDNDFTADAKYVVTMDPLDGSSNIDVNASIGTIFAIYRRQSKSGAGTEADCLQKGDAQVAAGYVIYGSSTMMIYTTGSGVNGFTLDPSIGEFCLSHPNIRTPERGKIFSINEGNYPHFSDGIRKYIEFAKADHKASDRPYSARYIGSLVADFHRNLLKGGIFLYPATTTAKKGKLRLVYECNPLAFIAEQAGGKATDGRQRIMDIQPGELHQRVPLFIGSAAMVDELEKLLD
ncbi:MAG: class 1 fructose-bisphosphatase [Bacteroidia bacterium]